ncbi:hypothetical protein HUE56_29820 (plasmid) [Azospirillum oryzae]|uniref:Uncharacterized protein n=1 Tax=Azospirillum oryzae TaxID=286727 RepID=A0A6N1B684_9PROT|nr:MULTISPECIES: hypothetical protein [Azospirillum]KAA0584725.1 hypothetical protein FZ938_28445 [Azospirillum oryzae]PWC82449.1 hypothetical protein TSO5_30765 [Azospirillum sp. TSO5]QCG99245.1 hypothetical protein E6C67_36265 [Azospirillum sp. TSA2s]QKS54702.1 hypothetical protein HUE56_29820 [Azospirillum oryzae]GLR77595.1 hypothetical protein GCM10007856_02630 [Azospirillum oryzae]
MTNLVLVASSDLQVGDFVDLEGDLYADPRHNHPAFDCLYMEVVEVERESDACVAIGFEGFDIVGFPPDHVLKVLRPATSASSNDPTS